MFSIFLNLWCKEEEKASAAVPVSSCQPCSEAIPGSNLSDSATPPFPTSARDKLTEQQTEDSCYAVQSPADKPNSTSLQTSTKESGPAAPGSSEQTPQECDLVAKQFAFKQDRDETTSQETQILSARPDDTENHNTNQHIFAEQTDRKQEQAARDEKCSADRCPTTKEKAKSTEVVIFMVYILSYFFFYFCLIKLCCHFLSFFFPPV